MITLRQLNSGDRVALVAPASSFPVEELAAGVAELARLGLEAVYDESIFDQDRFVAGSPAVRAQAIQKAWADPSIGALVAMRGGYGSAQVLPLLDPGLARRSRKALIGYSDITAILSFYQQQGLTAIHGPMIDRRISKGPMAYDESSFRRVVMSAEPHLAGRHHHAAGVIARHAVGVRGRARVCPVSRGHRREAVSDSPHADAVGPGGPGQSRERDCVWRVPRMR